MQGWMAKMALGLARDDFYIFSVLFIGEGGEGVREEKGEAAATSALVATTEKSVACKA